MARYKVTLLCIDSSTGYEDAHCYTVDGKNDTEAADRAVVKCRNHYPEYDTVKTVRTEYMGK